MTLDLKDFYLNTPMERQEFLRMKIDHFPQDVIDHYSLKDKVDEKGYLMVRVEKGMYGLPQAGILAQQLLEKRLEDEGYRQSTTTPGYFKHDWRPISFSLVVDDFGVKYVGEQHANHLLSVLREFYVVDKTRKVVSTAASQLTGITTNAKCTCRCLATVPKRYNDSDTIQRNGQISHMNTVFQRMAQKFSKQRSSMNRQQ